MRKTDWRSPVQNYYKARYKPIVDYYETCILIGGMIMIAQ